MKFLHTLLEFFSTRTGKIWLIIGFSWIVGLTVIEYLLLVCTVLLIEIVLQLEDIAEDIENLSEVSQ